MAIQDITDISIYETGNGGDLNLRGLEIQSLPKGLKVLGVLYIFDTKLEEYSNEELREMIYPGFIKGEIKK
jgi:hypothetical protein